MKDKYYDFTSTFIMGVIFTFIGVILLIGKDKLYKELIEIAIFLFWGKSFIDMAHLFFRKEDKNKRKKRMIFCIFHLITSLIFILLPEVILSIMPVLFSFYLLLVGIIQFIIFLLEIKQEKVINYFQVIVAFIYIVFSLTIVLSPIKKLNIFLIMLSIYMITLGVSYLSNSIIEVIPFSTKNYFKRKIRITLPKLIEAIIPYSVMLEINRNLETEVPNIVKKDNIKEKRPSLHILIHTSNRGFNKMGHLDICFNDLVISYGNYNEGSRFVGQFFGDGILFLIDNKNDYINFCIDNSKKTIFDFGIVLSEKQEEFMQKKIDLLLDSTYSWDPTKDKKYKDGNSYAGKLQKRTNAKFYKFKSGKYRTYFVLGTNCCLLADDIISTSGMDILSINGIITPGTYYDYLNRSINFKNSPVVTKEIFNKNNRC